MADTLSATPFQVISCDCGGTGKPFLLKAQARAGLVPATGMGASLREPNSQPRRRFERACQRRKGKPASAGCRVSASASASASLADLRGCAGQPLPIVDADPASPFSSRPFFPGPRVCPDPANSINQMISGGLSRSDGGDDGIRTHEAPLRAYSLSRGAPSTTRPRLHRRI